MIKKSIYTIGLISILSLQTPAFTYAAEQSAELPSISEIKDVCDYINNVDPATRNTKLIKSGKIDVNNDKIAEEVKPCKVTGTAGGDCFEITNAEGKDLTFDTQDIKDSDLHSYGKGILPYKGRNWFLYTQKEDGVLLESLAYVSPENKEYLACKFTPKVAETSSDKNNLCKNIYSEKPSINYIAPIAVTKEIEVGRRETHAYSIASVDFDNDGTKENLVLLEYSSGAARGCDFKYYDILDKSGEKILYGKQHSTLMKLQNLTDYKEGSNEHADLDQCGRKEPKWFTEEGKTYLEIYKGNRYEVKPNFVRSVNKDQVKEVCKKNTKVIPSAIDYLEIK